jgi:gremlin
MTRVQFAAIFIFFHIIECHRPEMSGSIMEIIRKDHVEKILADRRQSRLAEETDTEDTYPTSDTIIDFDYNTNHPPKKLATPHDDFTMRYNDSLLISPLAARFPNVDPKILADLQNYRGEKILKSSKSALFIAKKELLKQDWCKTQPFEQKIHEDGCHSKRITNNFCYGQCNSFYIPKMSKRRRRAHGKQQQNQQQQQQHRSHAKHQQTDSFRSCAYCKPKESTNIVVTLKCPSLTPQFRRKRVQIVKECRCIAQSVN